MSRQYRVRLVPPKTRFENQSPEEESIDRDKKKSQNLQN
jgi:hypothetical protein